jgi:anti-anti-sigma factor
MELVIEELAEGVTRAALKGRLDIDGAAAVDTGLRSLADGRDRLVIDLSDVSFVASMGLRTLMVCARSMVAHGGRMAISGPQPSVGRVLSVSGVDQILTIAPSLEAAVAAIR